MKSYTDLKQSKKLAEFLPPESADMHYVIMGDDEDPQSMAGLGEYIGVLPTIPCWSLAALLEIIPWGQVNRMTNSNKWEASSWENYNLMHYVEEFDTPVDACVAIIELLHEQNLL